MDLAELYKLPKDLLIKIILDVRKKFMEEIKNDMKLAKTMQDYSGQCLQDVEEKLCQSIVIDVFTVEFSKVHHDIHNNRIHTHCSYYEGDEEAPYGDGGDIAMLEKDLYFFTMDFYDWDNPEKRFTGDNLHEDIHPLIKERWSEIKERLEKIYDFREFCFGPFQELKFFGV